MILTDKHIEAIKTAALPVEYGSITIEAGTGDHLGITIENRVRLPRESETNKKPPLLVRHTDKR
jgi:hypothetical protein